MVAILAAILHVGDVVIADAGHVRQIEIHLDSFSSFVQNWLAAPFFFFLLQDTVRVMSPLTLLQNIAALLDLDALQLRRSFEVTHVLARGRSC